jgi:hypothetical protein
LAKKENSPFTKFTVHQVDTAVDCGLFVKPRTDPVANRGAAIMGLSLAKYGEITFKDGKMQQGNFDDFPVNQIDETPLVTNVHIVPADPDTPPGGVGEPGVPPFAPALINTIFAATGKRIRTHDRLETQDELERSSSLEGGHDEHKSDDARSDNLECPSFERSRGGRPDKPATRRHSNATGDDDAAGANICS